MKWQLRKTAVRVIIYFLFYTFQNWRKTMSETTEKWSNLEETAEYLGVTKDTIRNWIKKTDIPAHKIGRLWKFKFSEVDEWVKSGNAAL